MLAVQGAHNLLGRLGEAVQQLQRSERQNKDKL